MTRNNHDELEKRESIEQDTDQVLQVLEHFLNAAYTRPQAPSWLTWTTTKTRFMEEQGGIKSAQALARYGFPPRKFSRGLSISLGLLLLLTLLTAATFVLSPLIQRTLGFTSGSHRLVQDGQFTPLHLSKTINGKQVTLEAAYADADQVIIGLTGASGADMTVKTKQGAILPILVENGDGNGLSIVCDASNLSASAKQLDLSLLLTYGQATAAFDFTLPSHGGQVLTPHTSITTAGTTVTLTKVVIAPSGTSVIVQGLPKPAVGIPFSSQITIPGDSHPYDYGITHPEADGTFNISYSHSWVGKPGTWTLKISQGSQARTWVFHFQVS